MAGILFPSFPPSLPFEGFPASLLVGALSVPQPLLCGTLTTLTKVSTVHCGTLQGLLDRRQKPDKRELYNNDNDKVRSK